MAALLPRCAKGTHSIGSRPAEYPRWELRELCGVQPQGVGNLCMLDVNTDAKLRFQELLDDRCARLKGTARQLVASLAYRGFGLPFQVAQSPSCVENAVFFGVEVLASYDGGWRAVVQRFKNLQCDIAKLLLGIDRGVSFVASGHVAAFAETRHLACFGTNIAQQVIMARARLLIVPSDNPCFEIMADVCEVTGAPWLDHALEVQRALGIDGDIDACLAEGRKPCPAARMAYSKP